MAASMIERMKNDPNITVVAGDPKQFMATNNPSASVAVIQKSVINKITDVFKDAVKGVVDYAKDVKNKTVEGVKSLDNIGK